MKNRKFYTSLSALAMLAASGAVSATTGTLTFSGAVANNTCTVTGLNNTANLGAASAAEMQGMTHLIIVRQAEVKIDITGCPASDTLAKLKVDFTPVRTGLNRLELDSTTMRGADVIVTNQPVSIGLPQTGAISPGTEIDIALTGGTGSTSIYPSLARTTDNHGNGATTVISGPISTSMQLSMTYQ